MFVTMPQLGETVTEGTIIRWNKTVGDEVVEDELLFEVSTDKVDAEVPSPAAGVVTEILVAEGTTVAIGTALAVIAPPGTTPSTVVADRASAPPIPTPVTPTPVAPALGAHVTRADVEHRVDDRSRPLTEFAAQAPPRMVAARSAAPTAGPDDDVISFNNVQRHTGERMMRSLATSAHTLAVMEADYSAVERTRTQLGEAFRADEGFGLTFVPFVARAVVDAIIEFPRVNATVGDGALIVHHAVHLGIAVDLEFQGLVVPVVRGAEGLRMRALARALHDRAVAARQKRLTADDLVGGTFTITNAGGFGTLLTAPIINQPQVAILSTDAVAMRPVAVPADKDGSPRYAIAVHPIGNLSLSFDHRALDGAYASAFLRRVVQILAHHEWEAELS